MNPKDIIEIVSNINYDLNSDDLIDGEYQLKYSYTYCQTIDFLGIRIWDDENEPRQWIEDKDDYEPLEQFLRNRIKNTIQSISNISI